ncbi:hypothetical protein ACX84U_22485, partial [Burkholderia pseudomallei]
GTGAAHAPLMPGAPRPCGTRSIGSPPAFDARATLPAQLRPKSSGNTAPNTHKGTQTPAKVR